jgi:mannose-6-phosphate isomerase-like protein (cupin superfamily)
MATEMTNSQPAPAGSGTQQQVDKPWGREVWWAHTDQYAGKLLIVEAGHKLSVQMHNKKDETSYLLTGKLRLWQGPTADEMNEWVLEPGASWRNEPGVVHTIEAIENATVLEVSTPQLDDVVRLSDRYGR